MEKKSRSVKDEEGSEEEAKWFSKEDLQTLTKMGGDFFKKALSSGFDAIKDVKGNLPKDTTGLLIKGKEELIKFLGQEAAKNLLSFGIEKLFTLARQHRLEFTIRIRKNEDEVEHVSQESHKESHKKYHKKTQEP